MSQVATVGTFPSPGRAGALRRVLSSALWVCLAGGGFAARAGDLQYALEIRDREAASYLVEVPVQHPGTLQVQLEWPGPRVLALRIEGPGYPAVKTRRAGPSPLRLAVEIPESSIGTDTPWTLHIRSLPDRGDAHGMLTIRLPELAEPDEPGSADSDSPAPPELEPWAIPQAPPAGAADGLTRVFESVEGLRSWVVADTGTMREDPCRWHSELLGYLADRRDRLNDVGDPGLDKAASRYLLRMAETIRRVDALRSSDDPILAGPAPEDELRHEAWLIVRQRRIDPLEHELDALSEAVRKGYASDLSDEAWTMRFLGCLTACERYFERRSRQGDDRASGGELAQEQWDGILAAADALEALVLATEDPPVVVGDAQSPR